VKVLNNKRHAVYYLKLIFSLSLIAWLFISIKWSEIAILLSHANVVWVLFAFIWVIISVAVSTYKWQLIAKASALNLPFSVLWRSYWAGLFFNNFLPSSIGGDVLRIYWSGKYCGDLAGTTTSVVVERILAAIGLSLAALLVIPFVSLQIPYLLLFFVIMALISLIVLSLFLFPKLVVFLQNLVGFCCKFTDFFQGIAVHGKRLRYNRFFLLKALVWSVMFQICVIIVNYCVFRALNITRVSLLQAAVLIPATSVAAMLPIGINGYGTREGAYITLFSYLGVSKAEAMTASIFFALIVSISSLWGGWIWIKEGKNIAWRNTYERKDAGESGKIFC
jgi:hypothetical protein